MTLDELAPRHTATSLEAAYAGAAALAESGLAVVCPPLSTRSASSGRFTVPFGAGALSVTPWLDGRSPTEAEADELRAHTAEPWMSGPLAEQARVALAAQGEAISRWTDAAMGELFALDWRLSELDEYARWFAAAHTGTDDDHTALEGLHEELAAS